MGDEWQLEFKDEYGWSAVASGWAERFMAGNDQMSETHEWRWHHPTRGAQPARVDDAGRLLGPCSHEYTSLTAGKMDVWKGERTGGPELECGECGHVKFVDELTHAEWSSLDERLREAIAPTALAPNIDRDGNALRDIDKGELVVMDVSSMVRTSKASENVALDALRQWREMDALPSLNPIGDMIKRHQDTFRALCDVKLAKLLCAHMPDDATISVIEHTDGMGRAQCYQMWRNCGFCGDYERRVYASDVDEMSAHERNHAMAGVERAREEIRAVLGDRIQVKEVDRPPLRTGKVTMGAESTFGDGLPEFDQAARLPGDPQSFREMTGGPCPPEPEYKPAPTEHVEQEIRAQLVDGLPGEWECGPWDSTDWRMRFGDGFQAVVELTPEFQSATGYITSACEGDRMQEIPHTRVETGVKAGGDYIMRAAQALAPKVEATRAFVERLRDE